MHRWFCLSVALCGLIAGCSGGAREYDLIVHNAAIWTGNPDQPEASVLAVRGDEFVYVGSEMPDPSRIGRHTQVIDAQQARIVPGLIDAHLHLISGGLQLTRLNLRDVPDRAVFIERVAARAKATPTGRWILGGRWSTESWPDPTQPNKSWIDPVTGDRPTLLHRMDGHGALANSAALKLAGITAEGPPDPPGGLIERDPKSGEPTGILKESAIELVSRHVPTPSAGELDTALAAAMHHANSHGITAVHTMSPWNEYAVLDRARKANRMTLRVRQYVSESDWRPLIGKVRRTRSDDWLRICGFKQFMDGSLGSRTAFMAEPYVDQPDHHGVLREVMYASGKDQPDAGHLTEMCRAAVEADLSPAIHAIGDQANRIVLDTYEQVRRSNESQSGAHRVPLRIEHAQHLLPDDIERFATLGVVASMQPLHKADDGRYALGAIGIERCRTSYAFRSLIDAGAVVAFGSDWPVVSLNPMEGIHAAVTGRTLNDQTFVPEQNITSEQALRAYTTGAAQASGDREKLGVIRPGALADFVILDADVLAIRAAAIRVVRVNQTFVGGRRVYARD
ncbi:MAG: amidohydrolase [Phycisphaerae bacterium]|nr:MAG: amidohydrolase [Planctomycetia bacterium]RIK70362.1 MAG: amidohydrolase [Planctomycetota bacterium]GJQ26946.1 MAG: amidohydrolase [Phycisphaerae bacterium]